MAQQLVQTYSFRRQQAVIAQTLAAGLIVRPTDGPDPAALARIESELVAAQQAVTGRRYQDAIGHYRTAETLIWQQLDPRGPSRWVTGFVPPRSETLYQPLVELALEWTHVLTVNPPRPGPGPVSDLDAKVLKAADRVDSTGLKASALATPAAAQAISLLEYGTALTAAGNLDGAKTVHDRAMNLAPDVVKQYDGTARGLAANGAAGNGAQSKAAAVPVGLTAQRQYSLNTAAGSKSFTWKVGDPPAKDVLDLVYAARTSANYQVATDRLIRPIEAADVALSLGHAYFYEIPLGLAECYHALGDWPAAETNYKTAANYKYLNPTTEAPFIWCRLGTLYVDWGIALYKLEEFTDALATFSKVLNPDRSIPNSPLWTIAGLAPAANIARTLVPQLDDVSALTSQAAIATVLLSAWQQLVKLVAGLDFWGLPASMVPIWTYEYLKSVAVQFAQLAVSTERDVISYWSRAEAADLTRLQLVQASGQAQAEVTVAQRQLDAANAERAAYQSALTLANQRTTDANTDASAYAAMSADAIMHQALAAQLNGGEDGDASQLDALADRMILGNYSLSGDAGTLAAAEGLTASRLNQQYEVGRLQRQAGELALAANQAQAELTAAQARANAASAAVGLAQLRAHDAQQLVAAFDSQTFTPEVWWRLGDTLDGIYQRYLSMALQVARLMQHAYNFETDSNLHVIRADYASVEVAGLLAADALLADIEQFDFDLVTQTKDKVQPVKLTLSLAEKYGYAFETQFRGSGAIDFETSIDDFDRAFPGTYSGRLEAVEVDVEGLLPATGLHGTLTNNGVSSYRMPGSTDLKFRLQPKETLVLSDYAKRSDELLLPTDPRVRGVFTGAGVASSWRLELPKAVNDLDYGSLLDVKLTFYYQARFDADLRDAVLASLAALPSINAGQRAVPLRWLYPDAFFRLQDSGSLTITLGTGDFPRSQASPQLTSIGIVLATDGSVSADGIAVDLATPGHPAPVRATTAAGGIISGTSGSWLPLGTGPAFGAYTLSIPADANPGLVTDGVLDLAPIGNVALVLGYSYTARA
jgi:hypothetical protein